GDVQRGRDDADAVANDLGRDEESIHSQSPLASAHLRFRRHWSALASGPSDCVKPYRPVGMGSSPIFAFPKRALPLTMCPGEAAIAPAITGKHLADLAGPIPYLSKGK